MPPPCLWAIGSLDLLKRPMVIFVGARNASSLGARMAKKSAEELTAQGITVVSGLSRATDEAAHFGALAGGAVAVQAGGDDNIYPAKNAKLADDIERSGLRLSEMPMGLQPQAHHFSARYRIVSGLAQAVVVVEAVVKSSSLITARNDLDQGQDVLAVRLHPFDARAWGCNMLIRDTATLVRGTNDVLETIKTIEDQTDPTKVAPKQSLRETAALHIEILARLGTSPIAEDQLARDIRANASDIAPVLIDRELDGRIMRQAGGWLSRTN
jgi:DNA processing protein